MSRSSQDRQPNKYGEKGRDDNVYNDVEIKIMTMMTFFSSGKFILSISKPPRKQDTGKRIM